MRWACPEDEWIGLKPHGAFAGEDCSDLAVLDFRFYEILRTQIEAGKDESIEF